MANKTNPAGYDFSSLEVEISVATGGADALPESIGILEGIEEISYSTSITRAKMWGNSRKPQKRTPGFIDSEGSASVHRDWWEYFVAQAIDQDIAIADMEMTWAFTWVHPKTKQTQVDTLVELAIDSIEQGGSQGEEGLMVPIEMDPMDIYYQGVNVLNEKL